MIDLSALALVVGGITVGGLLMALYRWHTGTL